MHIGKHELNENEGEWLTKYATGIYERCAKEITTALNKKVSAEDCQALFKEVHAKEDYVAPEPEPVVEDEDNDEGNEY